MQQNIFLIGLFTLKLATFDTIIISIRNSVQLNVDIDVVTLYGSCTNVPSIHTDIKTIIMSFVTYIHDIAE